MQNFVTLDLGVDLKNLSYFLTNNKAKKLRMFGLGNPLQPSLMFTSKPGQSLP